MAAQGTKALAGTLVVIERDRGDLLPTDVLPDVELGPVEQRMNSQVCPRSKLGLELVPELRRLVADIPVRLICPGREIALLGAAPLLVRPNPDDNPRERLGIAVYLIDFLTVVEPVPGPLA